jgi:putative ABC transport system permease protein
VLVFQVDPGLLLLAFLVGIAAALLGIIAAVRHASSLQPAEAMRPEPPARFRPTFLERAGFQQMLSVPLRMILRNLERQIVRTGLSILGIALAVAVLILGNFMVDALDYVMESQFAVAQRQDVTVSFIEPTSPRVLVSLAHLPGVNSCEPFRSLPVRIRSGPCSRRLGLLGLRPDARLNRLLDIRRHRVALPPAGLVLSTKLAEVLGVNVGQSVTVEVLEGRRVVRDLPVTATVDDFAGIAAYMDIQAVHRLMQEGEVISGAFLACDPRQLQALYTQLKRSPSVAGVTIKSAALESFRQTIAENLLRIRAFNVVFACIIACGVVYNAARITLAERGRELATLRVIGFTRAEVSLILLGELAVVTLAAIPLGLVLGRALGALVIELAYDTELFRIPLIIGRSTYGFAAAVAALAAIASGLLVRRQLDHLDLVAVLKSKE